MRLSRSTLALAVLMVMFGVACGKNQQANNVELKDNVKKALEQSDLKDVTVDEDKDKNLITLGGTVHAEDSKARAAEVAQGGSSGPGDRQRDRRGTSRGRVAGESDY